MHCDKCHKKKCTVIYHENLSGRARTLHLCADCANTMEEAGELEEMSAAFAAFSSPLLCIKERPAHPLFRPIRDMECICSVCATSANEIMTGGRVGCPSCYECFCIASDNGGGYRGRVARVVRIRQENAHRLRLLRARLADALSGEQYEQAAILRDRIRELESDGGAIADTSPNTPKEDI